MSMSGIDVDAAIPTLFNDMKIRHTNKYLGFKIEEKKKVIVDDNLVGEAKTTESKEEDKECFEELKAKLTKEPRYLLYDFGFTIKDGRLINKIAFIFWCPDDCKIGDKMIYASTKENIKKVFTGISLEFQANDEGDFDYKSLSEEVEKKA